MFGAERQGLGQLGAPSFQILTGARIDQIERNAGKYPLCQRQCRFGLAHIVQAAQEPQIRIVQRLDAQGEPAHAGFRIIGEARRVRARRIGFQRDFHIVGAAPQARRRLDHPPDRARAHQGRRAAAEEDRLQDRTISAL